MITLYKAFFFNERGEFLGKKGFSKFKRSFVFKEGRYNTDLKEASYFISTTIPLLIKSKIYFYNISNPSPLKLDKKAEPILNPDTFNTIIETKVIKDINNLPNKSLGDLLTPQNLLIGLVVIGILYYLLSGGSVVPK